MTEARDHGGYSGEIAVEVGDFPLELRKQPRFPLCAAISAPNRFGPSLDTKFVSHDVREVKNVTISMDEATLAWVRVEAAKAGMSVSRWIGRQLAKARGDEDARLNAIAEIEAFWEHGPKFEVSENGKITIDWDEMYGEHFRRFDHPALSAGSAADH
jgi:hypothetical protein